MTTPCSRSRENDIPVALTKAIHRHCDPSIRKDISRCVPQLAALLDSMHERPINELAHAVRELIHESCRVHAAISVCGRSADALDESIHALLKDMEHLRRRELRSGHWSEISVPPQMFG